MTPAYFLMTMNKLKLFFKSVAYEIYSKVKNEDNIQKKKE